MSISKEEKNLLSKLSKGLLDGIVGNDLTTSGGSTVWMRIKNGNPMQLKQGPSKRFFNGKENETISGVLHVLKEWVSDEEKLQFLRKFGFLMSDPDVVAYSAKFKPKR